MKLHLNKFPLLTIVSLLFVTAAFGQTHSKLKAHKVTVDGTSSLHDWTSEAAKVEWKGVVTVEGNKVKEIKDVTITILVKSIKSEKGKTMDNKTYEAFKSDKFPNITYKLTEVSGDGSMKATGTLTMAGTSQTVTLDVNSKVLASGDVQFTGKQALNMKDYKMDPPTAVMGTIKVGPEVTVNFDLTVTPIK
jgi:polyisoprenoid-binding protein YceI